MVYVYAYLLIGKNHKYYDDAASKENPSFLFYLFWIAGLCRFTINLTVYCIIVQNTLTHTSSVRGCTHSSSKRLALSLTLMTGIALALIRKVINEQSMHEYRISQSRTMGVQTVQMLLPR
jgi:hypothetical protein